MCTLDYGKFLVPPSSLTFRAQLVEIHEACGATGVKIEGKIEGDAGLYSLWDYLLYWPLDGAKKQLG
jgi:hypothetical protein